MTVVMLATGLVVPGALVALTPSSAGAQSDPVGPVVAQIEAEVQATLTSLELELSGPFGLESTIQCLLGGELTGGFSGPCVDGG
ncbi:MAG TPA: hypothetical protein VHV57_03240 [Acidimicrobiales bacterium]|nr:hypothetical protein [Acidimicrobiales bacterium]